jgi:hypothetical protein
MYAVRLWPRLAAFMIAAAVSGCGSTPSAATPEPAAQAEAEPAIQTLRTVPLTIITNDGKRHSYTVEVARTSDEQAQGLMYRRAMPKDAGMIFPFPVPRPATFWMHNTYIPLDMVFLLKDGRIESILADVPPLNEAQRSSLGPVAAVLELNAGEAARIGATPGDLVEYDLRDLQGGAE